jgi:hypothetical protein
MPPPQKGILIAHLETPSPGEHTVLDIPDGLSEFIWVGENQGEPGTLYNGQRRMAWSAPDVAANVVSQWTSGRVFGDGEKGPGIFVLDPAEPLEYQLARFATRQTAWARDLIDDATIKHRDGNILLIPDEARGAATWMGEYPPYMAKPERVAKRDCPFCGTEIKKAVPKCPNCHEIIDAALYAQLSGKPEPPAKLDETEAAPPPFSAKAPRPVLATR